MVNTIPNNQSSACILCLMFVGAIRNPQDQDYITLSPHPLIVPLMTSHFKQNGAVNIELPCSFWLGHQWFVA